MSSGTILLDNADIILDRIVLVATDEVPATGGRLKRLIECIKQQPFVSVST